MDKIQITDKNYIEPKQKSGSEDNRKHQAQVWAELCEEVSKCRK